MKIFRATLVAFAALSLAACAQGFRSTGTGGSSSSVGTGGTSATQPTTSQAGASESRQAGENMGAGAP